jgi:hypothetical protein
MSLPPVRGTADPIQPQLVQAAVVPIHLLLIPTAVAAILHQQDQEEAAVVHLAAAVAAAEAEGAGNLFLTLNTDYHEKNIHHILVFQPFLHIRACSDICRRFAIFPCFL